MRPAPPNHTAGTDTTTTGQAATFSPGPTLRKLVAAALAQRQRALRAGYSRAPQAGLVGPMARLQQWLATNPHPSPATVRAFPLVGDVQVVALGNAAGRKLLEALAAITTPSDQRPTT